MTAPRNPSATAAQVAPGCREYQGGAARSKQIALQRRPSRRRLRAHCRIAIAVLASAPFYLWYKTPSTTTALSTRWKPCTCESGLLSAIDINRPPEDRHIPATRAGRRRRPGSAFTGQAVIGICRPVQDRHMPASRRCREGVSSLQPPHRYRPSLWLGGQHGGSQKDRDVPVPTSARAGARGRHGARGRAQRPPGRRQAHRADEGRASARLARRRRRVARRRGHRRGNEASQASRFHHLQRRTPARDRPALVRRRRAGQRDPRRAQARARLHWQLLPSKPRCVRSSCQRMRAE